MAEQKAVEEFAKLSALRKWNEEQGRFVLEAWEASGETMKVFGARVGIWPQRLSWWKERLRRTDAGGTSAPATTLASTFVPMTVRDEATALLEVLTSAFVPMTARDEATAPLEPRGTVFTAATVPGATAVTVVVGPEIRIEVADLDATSAAWVAALVKSLREVSP